MTVVSLLVLLSIQVLTEKLNADLELFYRMAKEQKDHLQVKLKLFSSLPRFNHTSAWITQYNFPLPRSLVSTFILVPNRISDLLNKTSSFDISLQHLLLKRRFIWQEEKLMNNWQWASKVNL